MSLDKIKASLIAEEADGLISNLCKNHGLSIAQKSYTLSEGSLEIKVEISTVDSNLTRSQKSYLDYASKVGLDPRWLDKEVEYQECLWRIEGFSPRKYKYPVIIRNITTDKISYERPDTIRKIWANEVT